MQMVTSRPLRGGVDRNAKATSQAIGMTVAPYAGAWIETHSQKPTRLLPPVAPYAGAWIETPARRRRSSRPGGRPLRGGVDRNSRIV